MKMEWKKMKRLLDQHHVMPESLIHIELDALYTEKKS